MGINKIKNNFFYTKLISLSIFILVVFLFRNQATNYFFAVYNYIYTRDIPVTLSFSEKEELAMLKIENSVLRDENKKVRSEFSVGMIENNLSLVYMLLENSSIYGSFFVSLPLGKTPYVGMNIFAPGNIVVGQVHTIFPNALKIERLGQQAPFIASSLENEESIELQSLGSGLYFGKVSGGSNISLGDTIVLKGYPKAVVGTVVEIQKNDTPLSTVFVRSPYNINNKEIFYVIQ